MKKEARILLVRNCGSHYIGLILRGLHRVEGLLLASDLSSLCREFKASKYSGEVRYYIMPEGELEPQFCGLKLVAAGEAHLKGDVLEYLEHFLEDLCAAIELLMANRE